MQGDSYYSGGGSKRAAQGPGPEPSSSNPQPGSSWTAKQTLPCQLPVSVALHEKGEIGMWQKQWQGRNVTNTLAHHSELLEARSYANVRVGKGQSQTTRSKNKMWGSILACLHEDRGVALPILWASTPPITAAHLVTMSRLVWTSWVFIWASQFITLHCWRTAVALLSTVTGGVRQRCCSMNMASRFPSRSSRGSSSRCSRIISAARRTKSAPASQAGGNGNHISGSAACFLMDSTEVLVKVVLGLM